MSSGVSDQMKISGNTVDKIKNVERNIPWSQQVDEASYENLASPTSHDENPGAHQPATQFQYPPFNAKENQNTSWNNFKSRKSNNFDANKKHGKPLFYNNLKREEPHQNAWGPLNARKNVSDIGLNHPVSSADNNVESGKRENRSSNNIFSEDKKLNSTSFTPKKTTWASIASQPAKQTSRTTLITSNQKKKGPGMPPPPMVPGKHDLDVNAWDLPNQNPPQYSSPSPSVDSASNVKSDSSLGTILATEQGFRGQKTDKTVIDFNVLKEDGKPNLSSNSYGRTRNSPNEPTRKNWSNQHPLYQNRQLNVTQGESSRRIDGGNSINSGQNRYDVDQKGANYTQNSRQEFDNTCSGENYSQSVERAASSDEIHAILDDLRYKNNYNPMELDLETATSARFFVIKSYSEDDIHRSIKYEIWCSTENGNKRLDAAFKERVKDGGNILLFFSVNGSGHFCGMAQMMTAVDYNSTASVWSQDKWKGKFKVKWIYVKDVPNANLRHIHLENNDNKSVTKSRDTQEVPNAQGVEMLQIMHSYKHTTSLFDDFSHYEVRQREEVSSKKPNAYETNTSYSLIGRHYNRQNDERDLRDRNGRNSGIGTQKYFPGSGGGSSFRDRNNRNQYHVNSEHRKFENHRNSDYQLQPKERESNTEKGSTEYKSRHSLKIDHSRRDGHPLSKSNNRERLRGLADEYCNQDGSRFQLGPKEPQKDNENTITNRNRRGFDY